VKTVHATWSVVASTLLALASCSKATPTSPQSVRTKAASYGSTAARNATAAADALQAMSAITALDNGLGPLQNLLGGDVVVVSAAQSSARSFLASRRSVRSFARLARRPATVASSPSGDELSRYLSERVFTDANVEASDAGSATFRLQGDDLCPFLLPDGTSSLLSAPGAVLDAGCVSDVDQLELRIRAVEPASDALDLTLQLGPARAAPLTLELRTRSVALVVSLEGVKGTLDFLHGVDASVPVPLAMTGTVDLQVTFNREVGEAVDVTLSSSIRQAVDVKVQDANGTSELTTAARSPWASLQVDGVDRKVAAVLDLGKTTLSTPYQTVSGAWQQETATLGGLGFAFSAQEGQAGEFAISNVGLGDEETSVFLGGQRTLAVNLAPRHFAVSFRADPADPGRTIFTLDPSFSLSAFFDNRPYENPEPATAGMTYTWSLTAAAGQPAVEPYTWSRGAPWYDGGTALKVVNGTLSLTDGNGGSVVVAEGQCLLDAVLTAIPATSKVQSYASGPCP